MINFFSEIEFKIENEIEVIQWLNDAAISEKKDITEINYIFCDDAYLLEINKQYLNHDTLTDIISFDNCEGDELAGDIFISVERVRENAEDFNTEFTTELNRVLAHGLLHFCGYKDKTEEESQLMRDKEDEKLKLFHVEH